MWMSIYKTDVVVFFTLMQQPQARPSKLKSQTSLPSTPPPHSIPPRMQRRTMSASGARTSNNTSSSFLSSTPVPGDQNVCRTGYMYQHQTSFTSTTSSVRTYTHTLTHTHILHVYAIFSPIRKTVVCLLPLYWTHRMQIGECSLYWKILC